MMFAAVVGHCSGRATPSLRPTTAIDGDSWQGNHLSEPKRCSDQPGHLRRRARQVSAILRHGVISLGVLPPSLACCTSRILLL